MLRLFIALGASERELAGDRLGVSPMVLSRVLPAAVVTALALPFDKLGLGAQTMDWHVKRGLLNIVIEVG